MIHRHLHERALVALPVPADMHLDEDALSAFVEGRLSETESAPLIQHLVACGYCRRATVQLVRLDSEMVAPQIAATEAVQEEEPGRIRRLLDDLASRVLPSHEDEAVFAYHARAEDFKPRDEATDGANEKSSGEEDDSTPEA
jgi:hypothetical protein